MASADFRCCNLCGQLLPLTVFRKNSNSAGGYTRGCKQCLRAKDVARFHALSPDEQARFIDRNRRQSKDRRLSKPDEVRAAKAAYYQRAKERCKANGYAWRKRNPERLRQMAKGWFAKRYRRVRGGITAAQLADWVERQKRVCHWCGKRGLKDFHIDHIMPLSRGGKHEHRNLCIACPPCNLRKNAKDPIEWAQSLGKLL